MKLIVSLIANFYSTAAGKSISTAAVVVYQPFSDALRFNMYFHVMPGIAIPRRGKIASKGLPVTGASRGAAGTISVIEVLSLLADSRKMDARA